LYGGRFSCIRSNHDDCLPDPDFQSQEKNLHQCALRCARCGKTGTAADGVCRFATFSAKLHDCSLYTHCDLERVKHGHGYHSIDTNQLHIAKLAVQASSA